MESTRGCFLVVVVGLWMLASTATAAQEAATPGSEDQPVTPIAVPASGPLTANNGLDVTTEDAGVSHGTAPDRSAEQSATATIPRRIGPERPASRGVPWYRSPYLALVMVLALIVGVAALFKRYVPGARPLAGDALRAVGRIPLSPKQTAVLLHVGKRLVLVGVTADRVQTLAEIVDQEEVSLVLGRAVGPQRLTTDAFKKTLAREFDQYTDPTAVDVSESVEVTQAAESASGSVDHDDGLRQTKGQLRSLLKKLRALQSAA